MEPPLLLFVGSLVLSATLAMGLAAYMWPKGKVPGSREMATLWVACGIWCVAYIGEIMAPDLPGKLGWLNVQYVGIVSAPSAWMFYALRYSSDGRFPTRRQALFMYIMPVLTVLLQWTNPQHGLMRREVGIVTVGSIQVLSKVYGPWLWVHIAYSYGVLLVGSVALVRGLPGHLTLYRGQRYLVLSACALPWIASAVYLLAPSAWTRLDPTPVVMTASGCLCAWALFRFGLLDLVPAARNAIIEDLCSGLMVADARGRLVDVNPAAVTLLRIQRSAMLGRSLDEVLYAHTERLAPGDELGDGFLHLVTRGEQGRIHLEVQRAPLRDRSGRVGGEVVTIHDVTERQRAQREREALILELQQALTEVHTLGGLLPICAHCKRIRDDEGYWTRLEEYISEHSGAEFTHGICPDCLRQIYPDLVDGERAARPPEGPR